MDKSKDNAPERFPGPTTRRQLDRYRMQEQNEATLVSKPKHIACSSERTTGIRTRGMDAQNPTTQWCHCEDDLDASTETDWTQFGNQYLCLTCDGKKATPTARSHTPIGDHSLPEAAENSSQIASLTEEDEDTEDDENKSSPRRKVSPQAVNEKSSLLVYFGIALAILAVIAWYIFIYQLIPTPQKRSFNSCKDFSQLYSKYPQADDMLWSTLIMGVDRALIQDPGEPTTFIFLYNSSGVSQMLLDDVTRIVIDCFGSKEAIWRTSSDYKSAEIVEDYHNVLDRYRDELRSQGILVVQELDRVPPTAANIFFTICDAYEPLVNKAMIFFTIDISRQPKQVVEQDHSATAIAEDILKGLWQEELQENVLDALVIRLTENVFRID